MKILIVDRASAFSIWTLMNAVAVEARAEGHVVVYCMLDDGTAGAPPPPPNVRIHRIETPPRRSLASRLGQWARFSSAFVRIVRAERPDVVHTNFCVPGIAARAIARALGVQVVISTYHELRGSLNPIYRIGLAATDWTATRRVYVSATCARSFGVAAAQFLIATNAAADRKDVVVWNGVEANVAELSPADAPLGSPRVVFAGRLMPEKGADTLIAAAGLLAERGISLEIDVLGDGPARTALEANAAAGAASVRFHGWADHASTLNAFANADCVVIPSDGSQEGFGLALAEALATARRIVASDIPVFREVADRLDHGLRFFPAADPAALADAIARALAAPISPDRLASRRANAAARFDLGRMAKIYLALYQGAR